MTSYVGRFAPSPTGPLHAGSLVAALASWLDARSARNGRWLVRIEDVDIGRCSPEAAQTILQQLTACGLIPDEEPLYQTTRLAHYQQALDGLSDAQRAYPCACTRKDIESALAAAGHSHERHAEHVYPGTCRNGLHGKPPRSWRFNTTGFQAQQLGCAAPDLQWTDRRLGPQSQNVAQDVGDFVLLRGDGIWAYQLAVVVDDAAQGVTHIVRGEDLTDNTPRQILLQAALGFPTPSYLHTPLVRAADGEKLSKQHGAPPVDTSQPLRALNEAAQALGLPTQSGNLQQSNLADALAFWVAAWSRNYNPSL